MDCFTVIATTEGKIDVIQLLLVELYRNRHHGNN